MLVVDDSHDNNATRALSRRNNRIKLDPTASAACCCHSLSLLNREYRGGEVIIGARAARLPLRLERPSLPPIEYSSHIGTTGSGSRGGAGTTAFIDIWTLSACLRSGE